MQSLNVTTGIDLFEVSFFSGKKDLLNFYEISCI
jgi:hypothetical protein